MGKDEFLRIMTSADRNRWYKITERKVENGVLVITAEDGQYTRFTGGRIATASERPVTEVRITNDGYWKGKASFYITGFSPLGGARIYQDTRNYRILNEAE